MIGKDALLEMFYLMVKIRRVEERLLDIFAQGKIPGFIHVCIGQEAVPVGVCSCLKPGDFISSTHRGHGHALAKGVDLKRFMAEIFTDEGMAIAEVEVGPCMSPVTNWASSARMGL